MAEPQAIKNAIKRLQDIAKGHERSVVDYNADAKKLNQQMREARDAGNETRIASLRAEIKKVTMNAEAAQRSFLETKKKIASYEAEMRKKTA